MSDTNIEILRRETYLAVLKNSEGSRLFNSLFVRFKDSGEVKDVLNDGELSCAFFVSSVLTLLQMLEKPYSTVDSVRASLEQSSKWQKVAAKDAEAGDVVFYEKTLLDDGTEYKHVGFALGDGEAVSTSYKEKAVVRHPIDNRPIETVYRYEW